MPSHEKRAERVDFDSRKQNSHVQRVEFNSRRQNSHVRVPFAALEPFVQLGLPQARFHFALKPRQKSMKKKTRERTISEPDKAKEDKLMVPMIDDLVNVALMTSQPSSMHPAVAS
ncbi:hypothetical protein SUGI_0775070 [Cryptomeria japonica]|nr:hypothetical protein SUGI_0775070 [Cryptomeria japonica]